VSGVRSNVEGDAENLGLEIALCMVEPDVANEPYYPAKRNGQLGRSAPLTAHRRGHNRAGIHV
jgi:hypothetical protein